MQKLCSPPPVQTANNFASSQSLAQAHLASRKNLDVAAQAPMTANPKKVDKLTPVGAHVQRYNGRSFNFVPSHAYGVQSSPPCVLAERYTRKFTQDGKLRVTQFSVRPGLLVEVGDLVAFCDPHHGNLLGRITTFYHSEMMGVRVIFPRDTIIDLARQQHLPDFADVLEKLMPLCIDACEVPWISCIKPSCILNRVTNFHQESFPSFPSFC